MKGITVSIVYDDDHGTVRDHAEVAQLLNRAARAIAAWENLDTFPDVYALRNDDGVLVGSISRHA